METIEELKSGEDNIPDGSTTENVRICLIGDVASDEKTCEAALTFNVPIVTSENGFDLLDDTAWINYFILNDFEGPIYDAIYKSNQRIIGPPALQEAALLKQGIPHNNRPLYSYSMKGVITCFTGIRRKDELTRLVNLIHSMGGSIRKDMNSKVTHLICNSTGGMKYQYAMTFRLSVVKSDWVYESWKNRDNIDFKSTNEEFTKTYKLKVFEGQKICFFGFPSEEYQHMCDVLKNNGGFVSNLEDPDCTHVIMANVGGHFPENIPNLSPNPHNLSSKEEPVKLKYCSDNLRLDCSYNEVEINPNNSFDRTEKTDGIILTENEENKFLNANNLSPIIKARKLELPEDEDGDDDDFPPFVSDLKRKRESFDMSTISTDSNAQLNNSFNKKPKLSRAGSIKIGLKRRMSFISIKTPISNMIRGRRNSVDPGATISSINSMETTFNESTRNPVLGGLRDFCDRFSSSYKREINITPKLSKMNLRHRKDNPKILTNTFTTDFSPLDSNLTDFSTPKTPKPFKIPSTNFHAIHDNENSSHIDDNKKQFISNAGTADNNQINKIEDKDANCMPNECDISLCPTTNSDVMNRVVDEHSTQVKPEPKNSKTHILKSDWFWYTIQNGYADEMDYLFGDYLESIANTPLGGRRESLPISFNKRKRKRFSQRLQLEGTPLSSGKRRSSVSDAGLLSISGSFLDCTVSPEKHDSKLLAADQSIAKQQPKSMRYNLFMDFCYTESNYVGILETIVNLFKNPLEEKAESGADALLNKSQIKAIFSNFTPIYQVHKEMLEKLQKLQSNWEEDCLIGEIIMKQHDQLIKAYPPYVNFFEQMKECLINCDVNNPRFHAFLKINQAKPECGRQSLQDLMIRPVQRLPSISLLLNDILKHTNKTCPDHIKLEEALVSIKEIMKHINEDKRKTESQLAVFDIFNDIEGCPAHLVSSHRNFIIKCEVTELSDSLSGRGDTLVLYLFSDTIEVCKKRSRGFNTAKSPGSTKAFKHINLIPLNAIKYVIEICDSQTGFAITCRQNQDLGDKLYSFVILDEEIDRAIYLKSICKQIAENACRTDTDKPFVSMTSQELEIDISNVNLSTLSKAFKFATRTRIKVGRAFSFNKTPSKLKRAVSTIIPSPFGSTNSLTPSSHISSHIANMRLASCTNINEVGEEIDCNNDVKSEILIPPMSVQPTRKAKSSTIASLRRI